MKSKKKASQQELVTETPESSTKVDTINNNPPNQTSLEIVNPVRPGSLDVTNSNTNMSSTDLTTDLPDLSDLLPKGKNGKTINDVQSGLQWAIVLKKLEFMDKCIKQIEELMSKYRDVEKQLVARVYQRRLTDIGIVIQKTYILGAERADIKNFYDKFYKMTSTCEEYSKKIVEILNTRNFTPADKAVLDKELQAGNGIIDIGKKLVEDMLPFLDQYQTHVELPASKSTENTKDFRDLLCTTQKVARQAEILFMNSFQDLLAIHPELRQDYQEIEYQTNTVYNRLMVMSGVVYMDGKQLSTALKTIMKALKNLSGDFESMKMQLISNIRVAKKESPKSVLKKLVEGAVKMDLEGDESTE